MADLNSLGFGKEQMGEGSYEGIPQQRGGSYADPPQPGRYRFRMPTREAMAQCWDKRDSDKGPRIVAELRDTAALTIVQTPASDIHKPFLNTTVGVFFDNVERRQGDQDGEWSDLDMLFYYAFGDSKRPKSNQEYAQRLLSYAGKEFSADLELGWFCNDRKPIRVRGDENAIVVLDGKDGREEKLGCGANYYMDNRLPPATQEDGTKVYDIVARTSRNGNENFYVGKDGEGRFPVYITCGEGCEAELRGNVRLRRFGK